MLLRRWTFASLLALAGAAALAEDADHDHDHPPGPPPDSAEAHFDAFMTAWGKIAVRIPAGTVRTLRATMTGGPVEVTGTVEIEAHSPADGVIAFKKTITLDHKEDLEAKHVMLPPILVAREWPEPLPVILPEHADAKIEENVELKVGEKTLKCTKLTLTVGDKAAPDAVTTWWICDQDGLGLVRTTAEVGKDKKMDLVLTSWKVPQK